MKTTSRMLSVLLLVFVLSACGSSKASVTESPSIDSVHTAIVLTLTRRADSIVSTVIPSPTNSPIPESPTPETGESVTPTATTYQSSYSSSVVSSNACESSVYMSDVTIPDGTIVAPGETFVKTWLIQNNGTCKWTANYVISFASGDEMDGDTTEIDQVVSPGESAEISVTMTAPEDTATYTGYWRMANEDGEEFGVSVWVQVVVSDDADTITPTYTSTSYTYTPTSTSYSYTSTPTSTSSYTKTSTPTMFIATYTYTPIPVIAPSATPVPTATNTEEPAPTDTPVVEQKPTSTPEDTES
jgi:hypothetical protein